MSTIIFDTITCPDALNANASHTIEMFESDGELIIKVMVAAPTGDDAALCLDRKTPYTASIQGLLRISKSQLKTMYQAMAKA